MRSLSCCKILSCCLLNLAQGSSHLVLRQDIFLPFLLVVVNLLCGAIVDPSYYCTSDLISVR
jgi:hypothetical protein